MDTLELTKEKKTSSAIENISGSEAVLRAFVAEGVETIFGYPCGTIGNTLFSFPTITSSK